MKERHSPQKVKSFIQLNDRVTEFLNEKILNYNQGNIVLFSHGGPIRSAINIALNNKM